MIWIIAKENVGRHLEMEFTKVWFWRLLVDRKKRNILDQWGNNNNDDTNDNGVRFKTTTGLFRLM